MRRRVKLRRETMKKRVTRTDFLVGGLFFCWSLCIFFGFRDFVLGAHPFVQGACSLVSYQTPLFFLSR